MGADMPPSISPGATQFTRMPNLDHSSAICCVNMMMPAFVEA